MPEGSSAGSPDVFRDQTLDIGTLESEDIFEIGERLARSSQQIQNLWAELLDMDPVMAQATALHIDLIGAEAAAAKLEIPVEEYKQLVAAGLRTILPRI